MPNARELHQRRSIRLPGYDYRQPGMYFVTICTQGRESLLGEIFEGQMTLNAYGLAVCSCWEQIPNHFRQTELDVFGMMPNHLHGLLTISDVASERPTSVGAQHAAPLRWVPSAHVSSGSLGAVIRAFKSAATKRINDLRRTPGMPLWQRNYYEHIIRDEQSYENISNYIISNPAKWNDDKFYKSE